MQGGRVFVLFFFVVALCLFLIPLPPPTWLVRRATSATATAPKSQRWDCKWCVQRASAFARRAARPRPLLAVPSPPHHECNRARSYCSRGQLRRQWEDSTIWCRPVDVVRAWDEAFVAPTLPARRCGTPGRQARVVHCEFLASVNLPKARQSRDWRPSRRASSQD